MTLCEQCELKDACDTLMDKIIAGINELFTDEEFWTKIFVSVANLTNILISALNKALTDIKAEDIANALFFSKSYIMHLLKSKLHIGVMQYVRNKKILLAHQKIKNGEKPTEVYLKCGFSNYPSFYRAYTAYFGNSPKCAKNVE